MSGMKKFFGIGLLALLTTAYLTSSCSRDDFSGSMLEAKKAAFDEAFRDVYGNPDPKHTWGFGDNGTTRAFTRGNEGETYPATHEYKDANGTVIAGANMNHNQWADPNEYFGGWLVPDALTEDQKLRVRMYFQANPNLQYQDPGYRHFFVQQVYTGGTSAPETGNKESTVGADGQAHQGMTLNQLTVGEACSHINDFNAGTCTTSQVLDNGSTVNNGTYHSDQITLMVNVYDTSCFGYHETSGSNVNPNNNHNDKMALVSAAEIDAWAANNGYPGEAVADRWNRSFMGFDYELLPESDIVEDTYAELSAVPNINNCLYAWDGEKVMTLGPAPANETSGSNADLMSDIKKHNGYNITWTDNDNGSVTINFSAYGAIQIYPTITNWTPYNKLVIEFEGTFPFDASLHLGSKEFNIAANATTSIEVDLSELTATDKANISIFDLQSHAAGTLTITNAYLAGSGEAVQNTTVYYNPTYLLGDADNQKIAFYSRNTNMYGGIVREVSQDEMYTTQDGKTCVDLTFFQGLKTNGYHPITTDLKTWVKWQAACDGYYSDWIVTLTEAQRISENPTGPYDIVYVQRIIDGRIFCEDLGSADRTDIDYNDVVFDAFTYVTDAFRVTYTLDIDNNKVYDWEHKSRLTSLSTYEKTDINLLAAGGTIDITVAGEKVHKKMDIEKTVMANTYVEGASPKLSESNVAEKVPPYKFTVFDSNYEDLSNIPIVVKVDDQVQELTAYIGDVPQKFCAPVGTPWVVERKAIEYGLPLFKDWVESEGEEPWYKIDETDWYKDGVAYKSYDNLYHIKFVSNTQVSNWGGTIGKYWGNMDLAYPAMFVDNENQITITLDKALDEGDQIAITGYRMEDYNAAGTLYIKVNGQVVAQTQDYNNVNYNAKPNTFVFTVPYELKNSKSFQLSRDTDGAQIYITGITVIGGLGPQVIDQ